MMSDPAPLLRVGDIMILRVFEPPELNEREVATDPSESEIVATVRGLAWQEISFVVLAVDENTWIEGSGSLDPADGFSARYLEDGVERVSCDAPPSLDAIVELLLSYRRNDDRWRTMIEWC
jgi:hypothetical protein